MYERVTIQIQYILCMQQNSPMLKIEKKSILEDMYGNHIFVIERLNRNVLLRLIVYPLPLKRKAGKKREMDTPHLMQGILETTREDGEGSYKTASLSANEQSCAAIPSIAQLLRRS